jgi:hypothetical protein
LAPEAGLRLVYFNSSAVSEVMMRCCAVPLSLETELPSICVAMIFRDSSTE